ncbi:MAG: Gfo/Idh/MocA family oxidoreductase [Betaproteobacteria bacterium]|nr:Gfo/Idh/MocA family oxidoreductase [Betaproteobacteria bacterium]
MTTFDPVRPAGGRLRVAIVGAGDISQYHLAAWRKLAAVELCAVCDLDETRARARAEAFRIPHVYTNVTAMLADERLDALDIATWRETHAALIRLAADRGVHVLCQKPLTPALAQAEALAREVAGRVRLMVHENRRFAPHFRTIRRWIEEGRIGEVRQCVMTMHRSAFLKGADGKRAAVERAPYMAREPRLLIAEVFIHQLDVLRFLLGPLLVVAARKRHTEPDMPGETLATILLETSNHAPVVLAGSMVAPGYGTAALPADRLEIIGARASIVLDENGLELRGPDPERQPVDFKAAYQLCFDRAIAQFVQCLLTGSPFETEVADNLETLRLVEDAYALSSAAR